MPKLASYNGKVDSIENIKVSPMSRAFLFSDSVYEVISFYKNKFIDFETHLDRLNHSLNASLAEDVSTRGDDGGFEVVKADTAVVGHPLPDHLPQLGNQSLLLLRVFPSLTLLLVSCLLCCQEPLQLPLQPLFVLHH